MLLLIMLLCWIVVAVARREVETVGMHPQQKSFDMKHTPKECKLKNNKKYYLEVIVT